MGRKFLGGHLLALCLLAVFGLWSWQAAHARTQLRVGTFVGSAWGVPNSEGHAVIDKAIEMFLNAEKANKDNKAQLNMTHKNLSDAYIANDDFENGTKYYDLYLAGKDKPSAYDIAGLATIYQKMGADKTGDEQAAAFAKADATYAKLGETYPEQIDYANFMRARLAGAMDPDSEKGLAKPFYQAIVDHLGNADNRDSGDNMRLIEAYRYLGSYYYLNKDEATSIANFKKILEIAPDDEAAKAALEALGVK